MADRVAVHAITSNDNVIRQVVGPNVNGIMGVPNGTFDHCRFRLDGGLFADVDNGDGGVEFEEGLKFGNIDEVSSHHGLLKNEKAGEAEQSAEGDHQRDSDAATDQQR